MTLGTGAALGAVVVALVGYGSPPVAYAEDERASREHVLELLREVPLIDGHNDVPWQYRLRVANHLDEIDFRDTSAIEPAMHTDLLRLRQGGVGAQFWSVYIPTSFGRPGAARVVFEQVDLTKRLIERYPADLELALTADDIERIHQGGKIGSLLGAEGGHSIESSLAVLRQLYDVGVRYMTLTHGSNTAWADSATDQPVHRGLTAFGRQVVREMNRLGMLVDLSHVSPRTMHQSLDETRAPVIFSHSSAFAVTASPRNVPDDVLRRLPENGGVVMVTFVPSFINNGVRAYFQRMQVERGRLAASGVAPAELRAHLEGWRRENPGPRASIGDVADHIDHIRGLIGTAHLGIGSDFDGIPTVPVGLEDASTFPDLLVELVRRGYSDEELKDIAGRSFLRAMRGAEEASRRLQASEPAADDLIEELDRAGQSQEPGSTPPAAKGAGGDV